MKLVSDLLKQRLSFFIILKNFIKDRTVGFAAGKKLFSTGTRADIIRSKSQWVTLLLSNQRESACT
jgi:hypothetical protein